MDNAEVERLLDALDRRLALGEVDIGTYNQLKAKFSAQLSSRPDPVSSAFHALPKEAVALKCPGCMAPIRAPGDASQGSVVCEYCGGTFTLQTATLEMERLRTDIRKWISEVAGGASVGTTVDEASRAFIFKDKVLPPLMTATERATDLFGLTRYQPLFTFSLLNKLPSSPFHEALQATPDLTRLVDTVKETLARVQSPEIQVFAVGDREKQDLKALEVRCLETGYLSNIRHHLASSTPDGAQKAKTNLQALVELYTTSGRLSASLDPAYSRFCLALATRMTAVGSAVDVVRSLLSDREGVMTDQVTDRLDSAAKQCDQAVAEIEKTGMEPKVSVPAVEGTRTDAQTIRLLSACVRVFGQCGAETGESFPPFLSALERAVEQARGPSADLIWLSTFLSQFVQHISAVAGEASLPVVSDFGWVDGRVVETVRSSLFGGKETAEGEKKVLLPFWLAELDFSQQKGVIFKKGQAVQGLVFLEAARHSGQCCVVSAGEPVCVQCQEAMKTPLPIGRSVPAAVPVVGPDEALKHMKQFTASTPGYAGGYVRLLNLVYLPVAVARYYTKKTERREVLSASGSIGVSGFDMKPLHIGSRELILIQ